MTIVCHSRRFIFLKTRKTAGSSLELWLAPHLVPGTDHVRSGDELEAEQPEVWRAFDRQGLRWTQQLKDRFAGRPKFREHMPAGELRDWTGAETFDGYRKITIVRDPWERTISLWKWRQHREGQTVTLADYINGMERGGLAAKAVGAQSWDNWPIYTIGGRIVADDVIRYETLAGDVKRVFSELGIEGPDLPRAKTGIRKAEDSTAILTPDLIARIARLHANEIAAFGYTPPAAV